MAHAQWPDKAIRVFWYLAVAAAVSTQTHALQAQSRPDLTISLTSVSSPVAPGASVTIAYRVTNGGTAQAPQNGIKFYLSADTTLNTSVDRYLSPSASAPLLSAGSSATGSVSRTIPADVGGGSWYVIGFVDAFQAVTESSETNNTASRSLTVSNGTPPGTFTLTSPTPDQTFVSSTTSVTLSWAAASGAAQYEVYFGESASPSKVATQASRTLSRSVVAGRAYYWRVVAVNTVGSRESTGGTRSFSVASGGPGAFSLSSPADDHAFAFSTTTATLTWSSSSGATGYDVYFGEASDPPLATRVTGTSLTRTVSPGRRYYWRIVATNSGGTTGGSGGTRSFTVASQDVLPGVSLTVKSVAPTSVTVNAPITIQTTLRTSAATADHAGITVSFPTLTATGVSGTSYASNLGQVETTAVSGGVQQTYQIGSSNCSGSCPSTTPHLLVEGDWSSVSSGSERSLTLRVTPRVAGTFRVRIRAWVSVGGYTTVVRDPDSGSVRDQQGWAVYETTVTVQAPPSVVLNKRSVSSPTVTVNQPFTLTTEVEVGTATAAHAGISVSFPSLTSSPAAGAYDGTGGSVRTETVSGSAVPTFQLGSTICNGTCPSGARHLLVEADWSQVSPGRRTMTLTITPTTVGAFTVRVRAWASVGGEHGYDLVSRDPSSGSTDQQGWAIYDVTVQVEEQVTVRKGLTVITHGYQIGDFADSFPALWTLDMARTIVDRARAGRVYLVRFDDDCVVVDPIVTVIVDERNQPTRYFNYPHTCRYVPPTLAADGPTVIVLDWSDKSNNDSEEVFPDELDSGWREAAGDYLATLLLRSGIAADALSRQVPIHFIGHSLGTVVNSEAIRRLAIADVTVDRMTTLDPHDFDQDDVADARVLEPVVRVWSNVRFADNYWQDVLGKREGLTLDGRDHWLDNSDRPNPRLPVGRPLPGFANRNLTYETKEDADWSGLLAGSRPHSRVHEWYFRTINDAVEPAGEARDFHGRWKWYSCDAATDLGLRCLEPTNHGFGMTHDGVPTGSTEAEAYYKLRNLSQPEAGHSVDPRTNKPAGVFNGDFIHPNSEAISRATPGFSNNPLIVTGSDDYGARAELRGADLSSLRFTTRPVWIPQDATNFTFQFNVQRRHAGDVLRVTITAAGLAPIERREPLDTLATGWTPVLRLDVRALRGRAAVIDVALEAAGLFNVVDSIVWVDNLRVETTVVADTTAPSATLLPVTAPPTGESTLSFDVVYRDDVAMRRASVDSNDVRVVGPGAYATFATLVAVNQDGDAASLTATYRIPAPGGTWDAGDAGLYNLTLVDAQVFDAAGNPAASTVLANVRLAFGDTTPPSVSLTAPVSGTAVTSAGSVTVSATADDASGIAKVEFFDNGILMGTDHTAPFSIAWTVSSADNGAHAWTAKATDAAGLTTTTSAALVTVSIKVPQTITFAEVPAQTYGGSPVTLSATASSGLPVAFEVVSGPATVSGSTLTITGAGTVSVRAVQTGSATVAAAPPVDQSIAVHKVGLIARADDKSRAVGSENPALTIQYSGFVGGDTIDVLDTAPTAHTTASVSSAAGQYPIEVVGGADNNYEFVRQTGVLAVVADDRRLLSVRVQGQGRVISTDPAIDCRAAGGDCTATVPNGGTVSLDPAADIGYRFVEWQGDCSGTACQLTMTANRVVTAVFIHEDAATVSVDFSFTGAVQTWTVPTGVSRIIVDARGAQGGTAAAYPSAAPGIGGLGARVQTELAVSAGETLHVYVGGAGATGTAGFNGGGVGGSGGGSGGAGGGGGGATDLRRGGQTLDHRVVVAAGGGGGPGYCGLAGGAGGLVGANGPACGAAQGGAGGTALAGGAGGGIGSGFSSAGSAGSSGQGGAGGRYNASGVGGGGGGGGYFGGGGGGADSGGGGGGSSFSSGTGTVISAGPQGDGRLTISYAGGAVATVPSAFSLVSPVPGTALPVTTSRVILRWSAAHGATSYAVHFGESPTTTLLTTTSATLVEVPVTPGRTYRWFVVAANAAGTRTSEPAVAGFSVDDTVSTRAVSLTIVGQGAVTVTSGTTVVVCHSGGGTCRTDVAFGTPVTLLATPATGYRFSSYSGVTCQPQILPVGFDRPCVFVVDGATHVVVTFSVEPRVALTAAVTGLGTVVSSPAGISCGADCTEEFLPGTVVELVATPAEGWGAVAWSGACTGSGVCRVVVSEASRAVATFAPPPDSVTLTVSRIGNGLVESVLGSSGISCGDQCSALFTRDARVTLSATAGPAQVFVGWTGACTGASRFCDVRMDQARTVGAAFGPDPGQPALHLLVVGGGRVGIRHGAAEVGTCAADCVVAFSRDAEVVVTAEAREGYVFQGFIGNCTGATPTCVVTMRSAAQVTARFGRPSGEGRSVELVPAATAPGLAVVVPVRLNALGDETAIGFSLVWDPTALTYESGSAGASLTDVTLTINPAQAGAGRLGVLISRPTSGVFSLGGHALVNITFTASLTASQSVAVSFGDSPVVREVSNATAASLATSWINGAVTILDGHESDVAGGANGAANGVISASDAVKVCRLVVGVDTIVNEAEFQRADSAPRSTLGDGRLSTADCAQAHRDVAGIDPVRASGGPTSAVVTRSPVHTAADSGRTLRLSSTSAARGQLVAVPVSMVSTGTEHAAGFSVSFDAAILQFDRAVLGAGAGGGTIVVNDLGNASGRIGVIVRLPSGQAWSAGTRELAVLTFRVSGDAPASAVIDFSDQPVFREVTDIQAMPLDTDYLSGTLNISTSSAGLSIAPSRVNFAATKEGPGGPLLLVTVGQAVDVVVNGAGTPGWTVTADQPWLAIDQATGVGSGRFYVSITNPSDVIGSQRHLTGTVTLRVPSVDVTVTVPVTLTVRYPEHSAQPIPPIGQVDTPLQSTTGAQGAIGMTGWVVDDMGIKHVRIYRRCLPFESAPMPTPVTPPCQDVVGQRVVFIGEASVISGARPDVETLYPALPAANSAGWGFLILSNLLPNIATQAAGGGVGTFTLYAVATDQEGNQKLLGRTINDSIPTTVTVANDTIAKPFGAIDTPTQGQTVSGTLNNFGWALTPDSNTVADGTDILVPTSGATIKVFIDGASVGTATFNLCRGTVGNPVPAGVLCDDDVSSIFRGAGLYRNLDAERGPIALRTITTSTLTNGLHTIQWGVSDSAGRGEGIGSRYFNVLNSATDAPARRDVQRPDLTAKPVAEVEVYGRSGFNFDRAFVPVEAVAGVPAIVIPELGRVELQVPGAKHVALLANGDVRSAPVGVSVDEETGTVAWSVGPGYLGTYRLSVGREDDHVLVDVTVAPMTLVDEPVRMHLDSVRLEGPVLSERTVRVEGWALDPQSDTGSGIGAVHVWARRTVQGSEPMFLGVADLGVARPDVAAAHGARFPHAGFSFQGALGEGEWEITAFIWNIRTQRFEDARTVTITVK